MKKVLRALLIAGGAMLALIAVLLLAVNLYVQSKATQARIQRELSQRLGATLRIDRISVTPWSGLKLTGITMPQSDAGVTAEFLRADTFRLNIQFLSLFSPRLVITEIALVHPNVVWAQNKAGKWRLPVADSPQSGESAPAGRTEAAVAPPPAIANGTVPPDDAVGPAAATIPPEVQSQPSTAFTPEVRRVTLSNGNFHFLDAQGKPVATFTGVDFRSNFREGTALRGSAAIAKISLRDRFFLEQLHSPLRYDAAMLEFSQISARAAGGDVSGDFAMNPSDAGSPFVVNVKFHDVQADRIVTDAGGPAGMVQGRIEGQLVAAGQTADQNALSGSGEIYLRDGEVRQYSILVALGQLLQIDELTQLHFNEALVKYHIAPGVITVDQMLLSSANIRLSATGTIGFNGKMHLESQLAINDKIQRQLFGAIASNFQPVEPAGFSAVNFQVSGTVEKPKTNLMDKLVGGKLKGIGGVIDSLFGGGKTNRASMKGPPPQPEQAARPAEPAISPTASPLP
ncbi:MAG: AsmA-like C-terminal region-containing protein [Chthoniobacterales bacterium]